jgi:hypothetical protein
MIMRGSLRQCLGDIDHLVSVERSEIPPKQPNLATVIVEEGAGEDSSTQESTQSRSTVRMILNFV